MNHKQKLGYMALGAGILALGIIIGQVVTPDIEAQSNGVFDKIICKEIEVVDTTGRRIAFLGREVKDLMGTRLKNNAFIIYDMDGEAAVGLYGSEEVNGLSIRTTEGNDAFNLLTTEDAYMIVVHAVNAVKNTNFQPAVRWYFTERSHNFTINDPTGKESFEFNAFPHRNALIVRDKSSGEGIGFYSDANEAKQTRWSAPKED